MGDSHTRPTILSLLMGLQLLEPHPVKCSSRDFCTVMHQPSCQRPQSLPRVPLPNLPALQQPKAQPQAEFSILRFLLAQKFYLLSSVAYRSQKLSNRANKLTTRWSYSRSVPFTGVLLTARHWLDATCSLLPLLGRTLQSKHRYALFIDEEFKV